MTDPISTAGDETTTLQTAFPIEAENNLSGSDGSLFSTTDLSGGDGWQLETLGQRVEWEFTLDYTMPSDNVKMQLRSGDDTQSFTTIGVEYRIDGELVFTTVDNGTLASLSWRDENDGALSGGGDGYNGPDLDPGTHKVSAEVVEATGDEWIDDLLCVYDDRFNHDEAGTGNSFDNTVHEDNGYLNDPQLSPAQYVVTFATVETRRDVTSANVDSTWNNTDNEQFVEVRIGTDSFDRSTNSTTASTTHSGSGDRSVDVQIGLSRYPVSTNAQNATPRFGYNQQAIQSYSLRGNPDAINPAGLGVAEVDAVVAKGSITGDTVEEAGELDGDDDLLTRSIVAPFTVLSSMELRSSEKVSFDTDE